MSISTAPASFTMHIAGTCWIKKNQPRDITVVFLSVFTDCFCTSKECFIAKIQSCLLDEFWIGIINHTIDIFHPFVVWILYRNSRCVIAFFTKTFTIELFSQVNKLQIFSCTILIQTFHNMVNCNLHRFSFSGM